MQGSCSHPGNYKENESQEKKIEVIVILKHTPTVNAGVNFFCSYSRKYTLTVVILYISPYYYISSNDKITIRTIMDAVNKKERNVRLLAGLV